MSCKLITEYYVATMSHLRTMPYALVAIGYFLLPVVRTSKYQLARNSSGSWLAECHETSRMKLREAREKRQ